MVTVAVAGNKVDIGSSSSSTSSSSSSGIFDNRTTHPHGNDYTGFWIHSYLLVWGSACIFSAGKIVQ